MRKAVAALIAGMLGVFALAACGSSGDNSRTVVYHMDFPAYDSVDSLYQRAGLVIQGTVTGTARVQELRPTAVTDPKLNPNAGTGNRESADQAVVVTVYKVTVDKVYKGSAKVGSTVEVKQLGGNFNGVSYRQEGLTPLRNGPSVLFLAVYPDAPASLLNPDQAQYPLDAAGRPTKVGANNLTFSMADLTRLAGGK